MKEYLTNSGEVFYILEELRRKVGKKNNKMLVVQFKDTGTTKIVYKENAMNGKMKDQFSLSVLGVGYLGDFEKTYYWKQAKQLWCNMMKRCYNPKDEKGYYGRCFVDARWRSFENFNNDLPKLKNFNLWIEGQTNGGVKFNLDKDFLIPANNVYSKTACMFVEDSINKADGATRGKPFTKNPRVG